MKPRSKQCTIKQLLSFFILYNFSNSWSTHRSLKRGKKKIAYFNMFLYFKSYSNHCLVVIPIGQNLLPAFLIFPIFITLFPYPLYFSFLCYYLHRIRTVAFILLHLYIQLQFLFSIFGKINNMYVYISLDNLTYRTFWLRRIQTIWTVCSSLS